jgi:hypothetical protein
MNKALFHFVLGLAAFTAVTTTSGFAGSSRTSLYEPVYKPFGFYQREVTTTPEAKARDRLRREFRIDRGWPDQSEPPHAVFKPAQEDPRLPRELKSLNELKSPTPNLRQGQSKEFFRGFHPE